VPGIDRRIVLPDGRCLAYDEGAPDGRPVFYFHGCSDSRGVRNTVRDG
jgi:hypothetical protein